MSRNLRMFFSLQRAVRSLIAPGRTDSALGARERSSYCHRKVECTRVINAPSIVVVAACRAGRSLLRFTAASIDANHVKCTIYIQNVHMIALAGRALILTARTTREYVPRKLLFSNKKSAIKIWTRLIRSNRRCLCLRNANIIRMFGFTQMSAPNGNYYHRHDLFFHSVRNRDFRVRFIFVHWLLRLSAR